MSSNVRIPKRCLYCGTEFIARQFSTKYCSHKCASDANKQPKRASSLIEANKVVESNPILRQSPNLHEKEIYSMSEAATYMGIGKSTGHRYCIENKLKCVKINRRIFIRKQDIHAVLDTAADYEVAKQQPRKPFTEFYTAREIAGKYGCTTDAVHRYCKPRNIPIIKRGQFYFYSKDHIDKLYSLREHNPEIAEWYSVEEIMDRYHFICFPISGIDGFAAIITVILLGR